MMTVLPALAAAIPPFEPRHDITVAVFEIPPCKISSQPMMLRPWSFSHFSIRCMK